MPDNPIPSDSKSQPDIHLILNPAAGGGKTGKYRDRIIHETGRRFGNKITVWITRKPLDAIEFARQAIDKGAQLIIVAGGDGTIQETVNGIFADNHAAEISCELGIINTGTSNGLAQGLGLPKSLDRQLDLIQERKINEIDIGRIKYGHKDGSYDQRLFVNECQVGIGGAVVEGVQMQHKRLGGFLGFGVVAVKELLRYKNRMTSITVEDEPAIERSSLGIVVCNGPFCGGGMKLAADADLCDGLLDVLIIHELSVMKRLLAFPKIYQGKHLQLDCCSYFRVKRISIVSPYQLPVAADGEMLGVTPVEIDLLPVKLRVCASI